jgi:hypothetical protein
MRKVNLNQCFNKLKSDDQYNVSKTSPNRVDPHLFEELFNESKLKKKKLIELQKECDNENNITFKPKISKMPIPDHPNFKERNEILLSNKNNYEKIINSYCSINTKNNSKKEDLKEVKNKLLERIYTKEIKKFAGKYHNNEEKFNYSEYLRSNLKEKEKKQTFVCSLKKNNTFVKTQKYLQNNTKANNHLLQNDNSSNKKTSANTNSLNYYFSESENDEIKANNSEKKNCKLSDQDIKEEEYL